MLLFTIPFCTLFEVEREPGVGADKQRTLKLLAETLALRDLEDDMVLKDADFPFERTRMRCVGKYGRDIRDWCKWVILCAIVFG